MNLTALHRQGTAGGYAEIEELYSLLVIFKLQIRHSKTFRCCIRACFTCPWQNHPTKSAVQTVPAERLPPDRFRFHLAFHLVA